MNRGTLLNLQEQEDLRVRGIATLALRWEMPFREAEKLIDQMKKQLENPDWMQREFETAMDAEFSC